MALINFLHEIAKYFTKDTVELATDAASKFNPFWNLEARALDIYLKDIESSSMAPVDKAVCALNARKLFHDLKNQSSICSIAHSTLVNQNGENYALPPNINIDAVSWLLDFGKHVSDEDLQELWGKVLAGELDAPGSIPKSVARILSELEKAQAETFLSLCSLQIDCFCDTGNQISNIDTYPMIPYDVENKNYLRQMNITEDSLLDLMEIGLIDYDTSLGYSYPRPKPSYPRVHFANESCVITALNVNRELYTGCVTLTKAGRCLSRFAQRKYNPQHMEALKACLTEMKFEISENPMVRIKNTIKEGICTVDSFERI